MAKNDFHYGGWNSYTLQCGTIITLISPGDCTLQYGMPCGFGIMTVNSPSGSTVQCDTWFWDDMPLNFPKCPTYWNSTSGFDFDHITAVDMSFCTSLWNFIQIGPPAAEKMTLCRFSKRQISAILDFRDPIMGSLKSPTTKLPIGRQYKHHRSKLLSFWENHIFLHFGDRQTNKQNRCTKPLSLSWPAA